MATTELTVGQVMQQEPVCVAPNCPIREVMRQMNKYRIGAVLVATGDDRLVGIFTERDLLKRVISAIPGWRDYPVSDWMTSDPYTIGPEAGWDQAVGMMTRVRVRHLPVMHEGKLVGIISARALMKRRAEYLKHQIDENTSEMRQVNELLLARDSESRSNLRAAGELQTLLLLPKAPPPWPELDWGVYYLPLDHLGGDYYDFAMPDPDHLGVFIADASGHSLPAAMVAVMTRIAFGDIANDTLSPGEVLSSINQRLQEISGERFVTAFYGVLNRQSRVLTYASAGHPYPLHVDGRTGEVKPMPSQGFLLGVMPGEVYVERQQTLAPGDRICFYTDGVIEARNSIGEMFQTERLHQQMELHHGKTSRELANTAIHALRTFCESEPYNDDVTLVTLQLLS